MAAILSRGNWVKPWISAPIYKWGLNLATTVCCYSSISRCWALNAHNVDYKAKPEFIRDIQANEKIPTRFCWPWNMMLIELNWTVNKCETDQLKKNIVFTAFPIHTNLMRDFPTRHHLIPVANSRKNKVYETFRFTWWHYDMEMLFTLPVRYEANLLVTDVFPTQRVRNLDFCWTNIRTAFRPLTYYKTSI